MLRIAGLPLLAWALFDARSWRAATPRAAFMDAAVAAWVAAGLLSALAAGTPYLAWMGEIEQREGLLTTLALAGLYAGARRSHPETADARRTLGVIVACSALAATYALLQHAGLDPLAWAKPPAYVAGGSSVTRVFATLGNPILLGNLLAAGLAAGFARLALGGDPWRLVPPLVLIASAIAATLSRGAWLAGAAGVAAAVAGALAIGAPRRRLGLGLAAVVAPAGLWAMTALHAPIVARLTEAAHAEAASGPARIEIARGALALWRAHPWLGTGPDGFGLRFPAVQGSAYWSGDWFGVPVHAHSAALQILATLGLMGALSGLWWLIALGRLMITQARSMEIEAGEGIARGATALALCVAGAVNPVGIAGAACFAVLAALMASAESFAPSSKATSGADSIAPAAAENPAHVPRWNPARRVGLVAALGTALVVAIAVVREMQALAAAGRARDALERAASPRMVELGALSAYASTHAHGAMALAPREDELRRLACDASLLQAEAEATARAALRIRPRASNHERLANALVMRARLAFEGQPASAREIDRVRAIADSADAVFAEARRLAPVDGLVLVEQARAQLLLHRPERALATAALIIALYPRAGYGHTLEAAALLSLGRGDDARAALTRAMAAHWEAGSEPQRHAAEDLLRSLSGPADSTAGAPGSP